MNEWKSHTITLPRIHSDAVIQTVDKAQMKIRSSKDNVAGVQLPIFESYADGSSGIK